MLLYSICTHYFRAEIKNFFINFVLKLWSNNFRIASSKLSLWTYVKRLRSMTLDLSLYIYNLKLALDFIGSHFININLL